MDLAQQFKQAVSRGDVLGLRRLFGENPELKSRIDEPLFAFDAPALVSAAGQGKREVIETLLELGADINARSSWWAGSFGVLDNNRHDLVPWLMECGAKLDAHAAARHFMRDELRELVAADPTLVNAPGGDGQTPLHVASSVEIAAFLLDHGAAIDALDVDHESTPAQYLIRSHPEIVRNLMDRGCKTDILMEVVAGDLNRLRIRLDANPDSICVQVNNQCFPMRDPRAGARSTSDAGKKSFSSSGCKQFRTKRGARPALERTPEDLKLAQACLTGNAAVVQAMMAQNPDKVRALARANPGYLLSAVEDNAVAAVKLMLEAGWPVEGEGRQMPLHWACWTATRRWCGR